MDLLAASGLPDGAGLVLGLATALLALELSRRNQIGWQRLVFASGVGFAAAMGWALTYALSQVAFDPVQIESLTFTGPSPMRNAMIGAALMGFGGMLAGGCAIGNGITGASVFAGTAWLALFSMWVGGMSMDMALGGRGQPAHV